MNKKLISAFMLGLLALGTAGTITSCKDYDGDISSLKDNQAALEKTIANLQSALDQAKSDANTAHATFALKSDLDALKTEVAKLVTAAQLQSAIDDCKAALTGGYTGTMKDLSTKIDGIDSRLNSLETTLNDPETGLAAAHANIAAQKLALENYKKEVTAALGKKVDQEAYDKEVAKIEQALKDLQKVDENLSAQIDALKNDMSEAQQAINKLGADLNVLTVFVNSRLTSLVLRPDMYYGGIESVKIFNVKTPVDKPNDKYHYFTRVKEISIPSIGLANYHVNPATAKLNATDSINFYSWVADINVPATEEASRASDGNKGYVWAVYNNYKALVANQKQENAPSIISVPFKADIAAVDAALAASKGVIMSLQYRQSVTEKKDTTITSDYALIVPKKAYQLLVCDNSFVDADGKEDHIDQITKYSEEIEYDTLQRKNDDAADNNHLHRSFDYLAKSNVPATHEVYYQGSIDITALLSTHCINSERVQIVDTVATHVGKGSWSVKPRTDDGCATVAKEFCDILSDNDLASLGLHYEISPVKYVLGTNGTDETAHIELGTDANGHVIAYPRSVTYDKGETIKGKVATEEIVGRMPILCIELKDESNQTVAFGYMKLVITNKPKQTEFETEDIYADCSSAEGWIKWHNFEVRMLGEVAKMSKETFDNTYAYDYYKEEALETIEGDVTISNANVRYGYQYTYNEETKTWTKQSDPTKYIGEVMERANYTQQGVEDPSTHILGIYYDKEDYFALYEQLKKAGKLVKAADGLTYVNKEPIVKWCYYKIKNNPTDTQNGIYVKLTIPAGKFHFAAGELGAAKILSYWYNRDSNINAKDGTIAQAFEVRVNVPTPQPGEPGVRTITSDNKRILGVAEETNCSDGGFAEGSWEGEMDVTEKVKFLHSTYIGDAVNPALATPQITYYNDDVLEDYEFIKDLHDYFRGSLSASVLDKTNFPELAKVNFNPAFEFTTPQKDVNAAFSAASDGSWEVYGVTGAKYTIKVTGMNKTVSVIKVNGTALAKPVVIACLTNDKEGVQSVIKWHQNRYADDILNKSSHKQLGDRETATLYIKMTTPTACAPIEFNEALFNVRFVRPVTMSPIDPQIIVDAPNDWQKVTIAGTSIDWRNYNQLTGAKDNTNKGTNKDDYKGVYDRSYYQVAYLLNNSVGDILTDIHEGTDVRNYANNTILKTSDLTDPSTEAGKKYIKEHTMIAKDVKGFELEDISPKIGETGYGKEVVLRYKNNSGITGNFQLFVPVAMRYVFGQLVPQTVYVTIGVNCSVDQPQAKKN